MSVTVSRDSGGRPADEPSLMISNTESVTIREAASLTGLTTHTLRYYERLGLTVADRSASGHRRYRQGDIEWIRILTCLRETGMPIQKMIEFTALVRRGDSTIPSRVALLQAHRAQVIAGIDRYRRYLEVIDRKIHGYSPQGTAGSGTQRGP
jgi:DNA-binding transcriptional MerR regulator